MQEVQELINKTNYEYLLISTSAKSNNVDFKVLPNRLINQRLSLSILIEKQELLQELIQIVDGKIENILIDVERKQLINLWKLAKPFVKKSRIYPYKPNDITVEAADELLLDFFNYDMENKNILVFGTGNISTKLAIRLAERNAKVYLLGKNENKTIKLIETINLILPCYTDYKLEYFEANNFGEELDAIISFVSAERVIPGSFVSLLSPKGLALDGGIGNYSEEFIASALQRNISMLRLDVRMGLPFLEASINSIDNNLFGHTMGELQYNDIKIVAGGIIGSEGTVIVDKIYNPSQIIGIANGIGGVKHESTLTDIEKRSIETVREYFLQTV